MVKMYREDLFVVKNLPEPLSAEEANVLFERYKNGDNSAREVIINHNIKLVFYIVLSKFYNTRYEKRDLISVGLLGLVKSVDSFDLSKGFKFPTYATKCITNELLMFIRNNKKYEREWCFENEFFYSDKSPIEKKSLDLYESSYDCILKKELILEIKDIMDSLSEKERKIVSLAFGLDGNKPLKQWEIASILNYDQSYISRLLRKTLDKIKRKILIRDGYYRLQKKI